MNLRNLLAITTALTAFVPGLAVAQSQPAPVAQTDNDAAAIVVTARRVEERLQDVPISITVFNQAQLEDRNITTATELGTYTPSLSVNQRYGPEKSSFAIRGFNQEDNTAPTVGVYFADVVGVRAQGGTTSGNTVGAGAFTDLQNVQVLKGPQGTLFGRNTTGGAVLLVPQKPTDRLEGYVEGTYGNYNERRVQAALNVPLSDTFRVRASIDRNIRDGYMINHSGVGPNDYDNVNYFYGRLSIVGDLAPNLENYTIFQYSNSDTHGYAQRLIACNPSTPSPLAGGSLTTYETASSACDQLGRQNARGDGPLDVEVDNPDPYVHLQTWQAINTTTWQASDHLTLKNIASYGEFREHSRFQLDSDNFFVSNTIPNQILAPLAGIQIGQRYDYIQLSTVPGAANAGESTVTEELQLQGRSDHLNWVIGGYLEYSNPLGYSAGATDIFGRCADPATYVCSVPLSFGLISASSTKLFFQNDGIFAQGTYKFTDKLSFTAGGRYTFDKITGLSNSTTSYIFPGNVKELTCTDPRGNNGLPPTNANQCLVETGESFPNGQSIATPKSTKPTWLFDVDYKPNHDILFYGKYARGYRQGGITFTNPTLETWNPEKVDSYEAGAKFSFSGAVRGYLDFAAFYNDFRDQQVFASLIAKPGSNAAGGAAIINAGHSRLYGLEVESALNLTRDFRLDFGYTYLNTRILALVAPVVPANSPFEAIVPNGSPGDPLEYSPKHKLTATGTYTLPLDPTLGRISVSATYIYTDKQIVTTGETALAASLGIPDPGLLPSYSLVNLNLDWAHVGGTQIDLAVFATNVTNKLYRTGIGESLLTGGFETASYGQPRMFGGRIKVAFGGK